jgi:hypothetical protein
MRRILVALAFIPALFVFSAFADDAGVRSAQSSIEAQLQAFLADDNATAYSYAAPNVKRIFPTLDTFMGMVTSGYQPVQKPQSYSFGKFEWMSSTTIAQQVFIVGPDGKHYEALYTLELQPDGVFRITGVSLRAANTLSTQARRTRRSTVTRREGRISRRSVSCRIAARLPRNRAAAVRRAPWSRVRAPLP